MRQGKHTNPGGSDQGGFSWPTIHCKKFISDCVRDENLLVEVAKEMESTKDRQRNQWRVIDDNWPVGHLLDRPRLRQFLRRREIIRNVAKEKRTQSAARARLDLPHHLQFLAQRVILDRRQADEVVRTVAAMERCVERRARNHFHDDVFALADFDQLALFRNAFANSI